MSITFVEIQESQIIFCKGNFCAASILSYLIEQNSRELIDKQNLENIRNIFLNKFHYSLINASFELLEELGIILLNFRDQEKNFIFNPRVYYQWKNINYPKTKRNMEQKISLENEFIVNYEGFSNKTKEANLAINLFLNKFKEINAIDSDKDKFFLKSHIFYKL